MSGPIVRTGTTPKFWQNYDSVFGAKSKKSKSSESAQPSKAAKKAEKPKAGKQVKKSAAKKKK
jgi:hypothetical protein